MMPSRATIRYMGLAPLPCAFSLARWRRALSARFRLAFTSGVDCGSDLRLRGDQGDREGTWSTWYWVRSRCATRERAIRVGSAKQRCLLAALLVHANSVVSVDRLADILWGDQPPADAAADPADRRVPARGPPSARSGRRMGLRRNPDPCTRVPAAARARSARRLPFRAAGQATRSSAPAPVSRRRRLGTPGSGARPLARQRLRGVRRRRLRPDRGAAPRGAPSRCGRGTGGGKAQPRTSRRSRRRARGDRRCEPARGASARSARCSCCTAVAARPKRCASTRTTAVCTRGARYRTFSGACARLEREILDQSPHLSVIAGPEVAAPVQQVTIPQLARVARGDPAVREPSAALPWRLAKSDAVTTLRRTLRSARPPSSVVDRSTQRYAAGRAALRRRRRRKVATGERAHRRSAKAGVRPFAGRCLEDSQIPLLALAPVLDTLGIDIRVLADVATISSPDEHGAVSPRSSTPGAR